MKRWPGLPSDATHLLGSAATAGPIPDDYPAALWWRILKDGSFELLSGICQVRGFDISVRDGSQGGPENLRGMPLTCAITTYPKGVHPEEVRRR